MEAIILDLAFQFEGKTYNGWAKPSAKTDDNEIPSSYHIVLNGVFFGNLSYNNGQWITDSQRDPKLVQKVGEQIAQV